MITFDEVIDALMSVNGGEEDEVIKALKAKREELGEDASEEEIQEAIKECLEVQIRNPFQSDSEEATGGLGAVAAEDEDGDEDDDEPEVIDLSDEDVFKGSIATVKEFLDENNWHYSSSMRRPDLCIYELGFTVRKVSLRLKISVETDPNVCRIDAILPITADEIYEYPLCKQLAKENYMKRFGSFKYDERDGEVSYEYSFLINTGIRKADLDTYFHAVVSTAAGGFAEIRKNCVGKYKGHEVDEILDKVKALVNDLS